MNNNNPCTLAKIDIGVTLNVWISGYQATVSVGGIWNICGKTMNLHLQERRVG